MICGKENVILGLPWLNKTNSTINWTIQILVFDESIDEFQELYQYYVADTTWNSFHYQPTSQLPKHIHIDMVKEDHLGSHLNQEMESQYVCHTLDNHTIHQIIRCGSWFLLNNFPVITCLTTATELAAVAKKAKLKPTLPPEHSPYALVFLKKVTDHVPLSCSYDHEIILDKSFKLQISKVYSLAPDEQKATKDFLNKSLKTGQICPSNSLQASFFFF